MEITQFQLWGIASLQEAMVGLEKQNDLLKFMMAGHKVIGISIMT